MSTIKNNLPTGSNRNKIEYLAEHIKSHDDTLVSLALDVQNISVNIPSGESEAPKNFLTNPCFALSTKGTADANWMINIASVVSTTDSMIIGQSKARPAPYGWGLEISPLGGSPNSGYMSIIRAASPDVSDVYWGYEYVAAAKIVASNASICFFNPFTLAGAKRINQVKQEDFSAFCTTRNSKAGAKFGIVELNRNGDVIQVMAEKLLPVGNSIPQDSWLHGIELQTTGHYAFFVEGTSPTFDTFDPVVCLNRAGVFQNQDQLDVVPEMNGHRDQAYHTSYHNMGEPTASELTTGFDALVCVPTPYGMDKHCLFAYVYPYGDNEQKSNLDNKNNDLRLVKQGNLVTFTGVKSVSQSRIEMFYSDTPLYINKV